MTLLYFFPILTKTWMCGNKLKGTEILKGSQLLDKHVGGPNYTALKKIFGSFSNMELASYVTLTITLAKIEKHFKFISEVRVKAKAYLELLCKYKTVITAKTFIRILEVTTPPSKDNEALNEFEDFDVRVQSELPEKRLRKRKLMPVTQSPDRRFLTNGKLYADFSCLDPKRFPDICNNKLQSGELDELSIYLLKFDERATGENLPMELKNLALHWDKLKTTELKDYKIFMEDNEGEEGQESNGVENQEEDRFIPCMTRRTCKTCNICCFKILHRYDLLTNDYNLIGLAFKYLLTLSLSQCACERSLSTLKSI
ncbi:unnamed protein product [Euphydryas editha]|uniref:Uncharacterized protein n=1 Tax=Euphydryas editha TaxID=104508 RepID=A0AAU9U4A3_EUPED|nr:unnamed protein product [Euphydryas editha]